MKRGKATASARMEVKAVSFRTASIVCNDKLPSDSGTREFSGVRCKKGRRKPSVVEEVAGLALCVRDGCCSRSL